MESLAERALIDPDGVALLLEEAYEVTIGDIFVALRQLVEEPIEDGEIDARSRTTLHRLKCKTWAQLACHTVGELWSVPNAGRLTVTRILAAAARRNVDAATAPNSGLNLRTANEIFPADHRPGIERLDRALLALARWAVRERGASRLSDLVVLSGDLGRVPLEISTEFDRLSDFALSEFVGDAGTELPTDLLRQLLEAIGPRNDIVVARRIQLGARPTLEEIGRTIGLTRERVRQLEAKALAAAESAVRAPLFGPLRWRASDLREVLGVAVTESSDFVADALAWAVRDLEEPSSCAASEVMLWLAGPFERDGEWLVRSDHSLRSLTRAFESAMADVLVATADEAADALEELGLASEMASDFMRARPTWRLIDDCTYVRWRGSVGDKADTILRLVGRPLSVGEINYHIGEGHAPTSLRNALASDERFVRLDKASNFGLREWGLEEYSGIAQEIVERIERAGGRVDLEDMVIELVEQFGVSASSVRTYAGSPAFLLESGQVVLRPQDRPYVADDRIERVSGLYILPEGQVIVHDIVDKDVLRGSGRQFPEAAANALGMRPGGRADFDFAGEVRIVVSWPATSVMGPSLGSVRHVAEKLCLRPGDPFRLTFDPASLSCSAGAVDDSSIEQLTGVRVRSGHEIADLALALRVEPTVLRSKLQARGDDAVLELLPPTSTSTDLGDAISTFGDLLT